MLVRRIASSISCTDIYRRTEARMTPVIGHQTAAPVMSPQEDRHDALTLDTTPLAGIVRHDFRAGAILDGYGLDYCCGGTLTLGDACRQRGVKV